MKGLIDTHTFHWWNTDDPLLSVHAKEFIADGQNEVYLCRLESLPMVTKDEDILCNDFETIW